MNARHYQLLGIIWVLALVLLIPSADTLSMPVDAACVADLLAYPYLGETTSTSVAVSWATDKPGPSEVRYSPDASYSRLVAAANSTYDGKYWHSATVAGLAPGTTYRYKVYTGGYDITPWPEISFTTAPEPSASLITFAVLGDSRPSDASSPPSQGARNMAAQINQQSFELALHTGDMVHSGGICSGDSSAWNQYLRAYFDLYRQSLGHIPFYPSLGNHELNGGSCGYTSYTNVYDLPKNAPPGDQEEYYSFDWGNAHFVALDTNQSFSAGSAQYNWLVNDLQASAQPWKLVYFHTPAYSSGEHGSTIAVQRQLVPLLEAYGVDVVFSGHDHHYERTCPILEGACTTPQYGGVVYYVTGGGGAPLYSATGDWFTAYRDSVYHFIKAQIDNCRLRLDAIDADGNVFDSYEVNHCLDNPIPVITSLNPVTIMLASPPFTLTVNGAGFINSSRVNWNETARATTFVSATQLEAAIPSQEISRPGTIGITVFNPPPGGGMSGRVPLKVTALKYYVPFIAQGPVSSLAPAMESITAANSPGNPQRHDPP